MVKYFCEIKKSLMGVFMGSPVGNINNVKIFVLYLMENLNYPMDFFTLNDIVMQTDYVMYLDFAEAFHDMLDNGLIDEIEEEDSEKLYVVTEKGRFVARELKSELLPSILDRSLSAALRYINFKRRGIVTKCSIERTDDGRYSVNCSFTENKTIIFSQMLVVDTLSRAEEMQNNFYERPEAIYRGVNALLAGNVNYLLD